jgi:hypothetical protein
VHFTFALFRVLFSATPALGAGKIVQRGKPEHNGFAHFKHDVHLTLQCTDQRDPSFLCKLFICANWRTMPIMQRVLYKLNQIGKGYRAGAGVVP